MFIIYLPTESTAPEDGTEIKTHHQQDKGEI